MKIDFHCHSYFSKDGICSPEDLLRIAKRKGLDGIAITDHNSTRSWNRAREEADRLGMILIKGEEIKIKKNNKTVGELLAYFIKDEINPQGKSIEDIISEIKNQDGICIIAHPFNRKKPFKDLERYKALVDGIEIFNSRSQTRKENKQSEDFTTTNNLAFTAGSDSHTSFEIGNCYIESNANTIEELRSNILNKKIKVVGKQSSFFLQIFSPIAKAIHLFWKF
jgi:hypothetical protein